VSDDHVELWMSDDVLINSHARDCEMSKAEPPTLRQWGIRLADGAAFAGYGSPRAMPTVRRASVDEHTVRLRIELPPPSTANGHRDDDFSLTVAYSDSDDGKRQKALIATSPLVFGDASTLGGRRRIPASKATCRVRGGTLDPVVSERDPETPVYSRDGE
jgi:hypothetical protein